MKIAKWKYTKDGTKRYIQWQKLVNNNLNRDECYTSILSNVENKLKLCVFFINLFEVLPLKIFEFKIKVQKENRIFKLKKK